MSSKKSILFIGEAVSLAHVTRPLVLAQALDPEQYEIHFACDARYKSLICVEPHMHFWPLQSIPSEKFIKAADQGGIVQQRKEIESQVNQDLELFKKVHPTYVIHDLRFTVAISAELSQIPCVSLTNVHWSPYRLLEFDPKPKWPIRFVLKRKILKRLTPWRQYSLTASFNRIRKSYGLPLFKSYEDLATHGDYTLYADPPDFVQTMPMPNHHLFLGPILWSPDIPKPGWWQTWDSKLPLIYVTLGSTGLAVRLPEIIRALARIPAIIVVATAGRVQLKNFPPHVYAADYLPGMEISKLASVVVCNGGSATAYQALSQGTPIVGIWSNMDQYMTSMTIERAGAGVGRRASNHDTRILQRVVTTMIQDPRYRARAAELGKSSARMMPVSASGTLSTKSPPEQCDIMYKSVFPL
jgi:UDP:flavonoid glycosyltransferase YjiC (YdhE family)